MFGEEALADELSEESKNPSPVSGAGPSTLRGLFHSVVRKVDHLRFARVSAV